MKNTLLSLAVLAGLLGTTNAIAQTTTEAYTLDKKHELIRPTNYRSWVYVGTPVTPNDLNNGKAAFPEMHNVYIDPTSYEAYKATGEFREGTVIIKELVSVGATSASSGKGYFEGEFLGLEASVKSKTDFPDEPGNWAIFSFSNMKTGILKESAPAMPAASCVACHQQHAEDDYVFTQYYPILRAAKGVGANVTPENMAKRTIPTMNEVKKKVTNETSIWVGTAPTPNDSSLDIPLNEKTLFAFLQAGTYKSWKNKEKAVHPSSGPHESVRAFMNDTLAASLNKGNTEHPKGSVAVKEQYKDGKSFGWAVMAKTHDTTDNGNGWFWYEVLSDKDINKKAALGNNVPGCVSCHAPSQKDMVLIPFPFK